MHIRKIRIIANPRKSWAKEIFSKVRAHLKVAGFRIVVKKADLTICIGGDGTILYANHQAKIEGAVLGIGGDKSVICQLNKHNWEAKLLPLIQAGASEKRHLLQATAGAKTYTAINDFVVHTTDYRVVELDLIINGKKHHFEGDGVIISSATGSYAYAYSAGGKKQKPRSKRIQVVPIAPYKREFKPHLLPSNSAVAISADRKTGFVVDGIFIKNLKQREEVIIKSGGFIRFMCK